MTHVILPSIYLGKLHNFGNETAKQYIQNIQGLLKKYPTATYLFVDSSTSITSTEYELSYISDIKDNIVIKKITDVMQDIHKNFNESHTFHSTIIQYINVFHLDPKRVINLTINESNPQTGMDIGKKMQILREQNVLLLGLGNITHLSTSKFTTLTEAIKEFDSWVRVKLWEFDYYALRDIENFFPFEMSLFLDNLIHYIPFLVIFGSLIGLDVLYDLFTGFEENSSLRSFYFVPNQGT